MVVYFVGSCFGCGNCGDGICGYNIFKHVVDIGCPLKMVHMGGGGAKPSLPEGLATGQRKNISLKFFFVNF